MDQRLGRQAVVIGASVAGLMTARVLADQIVGNITPVLSPDRSRFGPTQPWHSGFV